MNPLASILRVAHRSPILLLTLGLFGCAVNPTYEEGRRLLAAGQLEEGIARLGEVVRLEPGRAEYRIALANARASATTDWLMRAYAARRAGRWGEAEGLYRRILALEPANAMAQQGLQDAADHHRRTAVLDEAERRRSAGAPADMDAALSAARRILDEDPGNQRALAMRDEIERVAAPHDANAQHLAAAFRRPVTMRFIDAALRQVFDFLGQSSGLDFIFDNDVKPDLKATLSLKSTPIEDAVRLILTANQLAFRVLNDRTIMIYPATPQKERDYQVLTVRAFYVSNADVKAVASAIKTVARVRDPVVDERLGLIIVRDTPQAIRLAERIVALQDQPDPEVVLEMEVLEVQRSRLAEFGVQWPGQVSLAPILPADQALTLWQFLHPTRHNIQAVVGPVSINANGQDQDGNILANPRIRVRNREKARVLVGDRLPVITTTSTATGFVAESVNYLDVGLKLEVEPTIYIGNDVAIKVSLEVSNITGQTTSKAGTTSYQIGTRSANTVLRLRDGETQILAGLISDQDRTTSAKVPGLGDVPIAGRLFGSQRDDKSRSEILLSIRPHVVRPLRRPSLTDAQFDAGTEAAPGIEDPKPRGM